MAAASPPSGVAIAIEPRGAFAELVRFYESVGYHGGIADDCTVVSARVGCRVIGVVRLAPQAGHLFLRGMMIAADWQRCGVGSAMLERLDAEIGARECYCAALPWLDGFYGQIGFRAIDEAAAPPYVQDHVRLNRARGHQQLLLRREALS
jgi:N-acetylglutamate synthase-like GNAT family acetyltransferase